MLFELKKEKVKIIIYLKSKKFSHFFDNKIVDIIFEGQDIPDHDYHVHLLSILKIFYEKNKLFINPVNFFQKNEKTQIKWNKLLLNHTGIKIGINCNTSLVKKNIPIKFFVNLASVCNFKFIMLQKNFNSEKVKNSKNILFP